MSDSGDAFYRNQCMPLLIQSCLQMSEESKNIMGKDMKKRKGFLERTEVQPLAQHAFRTWLMAYHTRAKECILLLKYLVIFTCIFSFLC
jgi:hypothetical protein